MSLDIAGLAPRQLWNLPPPTTTSAVVTSHCTPFVLPSGGVLQLADSSSITLTTNILFQPECTSVMSGDVLTPAFAQDPFYASTMISAFVLAAATTIAWVLVIMLIITPRTAFVGTSIAGPTFSNGRGIIGGAHGGSNPLYAAGSRPWLQQIATLAVAISLSIATADTFQVAEAQYTTGYSNANELRIAVLGSLEIRIMRVISDIFLWLAQIQTLVRLFPRHKEKILIKWIGFSLVTLDTVFTCLNAFLINSSAPRGRHFVDAIPALSYLFELALSLLYAAWVIYYALTKRRYAFYHPKMRNICILAILSTVAILTPVVFFVTDVSNQDVGGWGDYFRWVGAAAASVVVWEWVERIEALEQDEKKDGILGREVFDGDDMLDASPTDEAVWSPGRSLRNHFRRLVFDDTRQGGNGTGRLENGIANMAQQFRSKHLQSPAHFPLGRTHSGSDPKMKEKGQLTTPGGKVAFDLPKPDHGLTPAALGGISRPQPAVSPISRSDTTSAASTVYVVRQDHVTGVPQPIRRRTDVTAHTPRPQTQGDAQRQSTARDPEKDGADDEEERQRNRRRDHGRWHAMPNPFKRKRASPPQEVQQARAAAQRPDRLSTPAHNFSKWDVRNRLGVLAAETGERIRDRNAARRQDVPLPVTVIPAQPRHSGRTWTPVELGISAAEETQTTDDEGPPSSGTGSTTLTSAILPPPPRQQTNPPRADDISPVNPRGGGVGPVIIPAPSRSPRPLQSNAASPASHRRSDAHIPPRADDISPVTARSGTTVVPAPPRRPPLTAEASDRGSRENITPARRPS